MDCMGQSGVCPIGNWCVCQWAFASYIQMAGGCDSIVNIVCDATNMAALKAYEEQSTSDAIIMTALQCLRQRCNIPETQRLYDSETPMVGQQSNQPALGATSLLASAMVLLL